MACSFSVRGPSVSLELLLYTWYDHDLCQHLKGFIHVICIMTREFTSRSWNSALFSAFLGTWSKDSTPFSGHWHLFMLYSSAWGGQPATSLCGTNVMYVRTKQNILWAHSPLQLLAYLSALSKPNFSKALFILYFLTSHVPLKCFLNWPLYLPLYLNCFLANVFSGKSSNPFLLYFISWQHLSLGLSPPPRLFLCSFSISFGGFVLSTSDYPSQFRFS